MFDSREMSQAEIREAIADGVARFPGSRAGKAGKGRGNRRREPGPEEVLHRNCQHWNELNEARYPILEWIFHCPNGGGRSAAEGGVLKAMGVKAGVPDFMLPFPNGRWKGLAVELKSDDNELTVKQRRWLLRAHKDKWLIGLVRELDVYEKLVRCFLTDSACDVIPGHDEIFRDTVERVSNRFLKEKV